MHHELFVNLAIQISRRVFELCVDQIENTLRNQYHGFQYMALKVPRTVNVNDRIVS